MNTTLITIIGFTIIFVATTLGAALVFFFKNEISKKLNAILLGLSAGIMIAASIWSLLIPSLEGAESYGVLKFIPASVGFILGGLFISFLNKIIPNLDNCSSKLDKTALERDKKSSKCDKTALNFNKSSSKLDIKDSKKTSFEGFDSKKDLYKSNFDNFAKSARCSKKSGEKAFRSIKLFLAITIHNIPEGLAVGFAFGGAFLEGSVEAFVSALGLSIGIAIQNFPEGAAVSLPLKNVTKNRFKAFLLGALSGIIEPIAAVIGFYLASFLINSQPWFLSFAAGAMIFVIAEDIIPEANIESKQNIGTWGVMIGFTVMMILDVALS